MRTSIKNKLFSVGFAIQDCKNYGETNTRFFVCNGVAQYFALVKHKYITDIDAFEFVPELALVLPERFSKSQFKNSCISASFGDISLEEDSDGNFYCGMKMLILLFLEQILLDKQRRYGKKKIKKAGRRRKAK